MNAITLDQFLVFTSIVDEGSFAGAARKLGRAQSAITYAVQKLEDQTGVLLFDRETYRPTLTEGGRALLPRVRRIMEDIGEFRRQAQGMAQGVEAELVLTVDKFLPLKLITPALKRFYEAFPMVQLRINAAWTHDIMQQLTDSRTDLGVFMQGLEIEPVIESRIMGNIDLVAVAAPDHPLAKLPEGFSRDEMRDHLQIVVSIPDPKNQRQGYGLVGVNQWKVSEVSLRHHLILSGIGWGSMPKPMVEKEVARGELVILSPAQWDSSNKMPNIPLLVAKHRNKALGPAASHLMEQLASGW